MDRNVKAEAVNFGSKTVFTGSEIQAFSNSNTRRIHPLIQCEHCSILENRLRQMETQCTLLAEYIDRERRPE